MDDFALKIERTSWSLRSALANEETIAPPIANMTVENPPILPRKSRTVKT